MKPDRQFHFLFSYGSMFGVALASVVLEREPIAKACLAGAVILIHIGSILLLRPHLQWRDDAMLLAFEVPLLLLVSVGGAAEKGALKGNSLKIAAFVTIVLLLACVLANLIDAMYHILIKEDPPDDDELEGGDRLQAEQRAQAEQGKNLDADDVALEMPDTSYAAGGNNGGPDAAAENNSEGGIVSAVIGFFESIIGGGTAASSVDNDASKPVANASVENEAAGVPGSVLPVAQTVSPDATPYHTPQVSPRK
jgi:hypothetical protein